MGQKYNCPSCGAELELKYRFSKMVICKYCGITSYLQNNALQYKGGKVELANYGSFFEIGKTGKLNNRRFEISGRLRFSYPGGFWDEWLLVFDDKIDAEVWLHEDEGDLIIYMEDNVNNIPDFSKLNPGNYVEIAGKDIFLTEKNTAQIMGGEGELPFMVVHGEMADFVDGIVFGTGEMVSFEFMPGEKAFTKGFNVQFKDFQFD